MVEMLLNCLGYVYF